MLKLPKVAKVLGVGLTGIIKAKKIVAGAALGLTLAVSGATAASTPVTNETARIAGTVQNNQLGAILLAPSQNQHQQFAQHYSHVSHYSHSSHRSHYSHYSSRY